MFVSLSDAATKIFIDRGTAGPSMMFMDVELESTMLFEEEVEYIFAPKLEIAISIPKQISSIRKSWKYNECIFTPSINNKYWPKSNREYFSFQSTCSNTETRNDYLITRFGYLVAFKLSKIDNKGNVVNNIVYVADQQNRKR